MPRPCKRRRVCGEPLCDHFVPAGRPDRPIVTLTVDEFEAIRLIDHEGLDQQACAQRMGVARTTVQAIYGAARAKLAAFLVDGLALRIAGGDYVLCGGEALCRGCRTQQTDAQATERRHPIMKIAVTYDNGEIFQHFGHTAQFKLYDVADGAVAATQVVDTNGSGHGALAGFLKAQGVDTLLCGGIGAGAQQALAQAGIRLYAGVSGAADQAVEALLQGTLRYSAEANCDHHGHDHGTCGEHGCGHHCHE